MLCREGKLSLLCFLSALIIAILPEILLRLEFDIYIRYFRSIWFIHLFQYGFLNLLTIFTFRGFLYQVAVRAIFLGYAFGIGILVSVTAPLSYQVFGIYMTVLATFHYSEFLVISCINPSALTIDSFILNHSVAYAAAACSSWIEFFAERLYFPEIKEVSPVFYFGLVLCICGEVLRKLAMLTAKQNFNHIMQREKKENHELVTHGVYNLCRHPSYVGWYCWAIGTQLILQNPFCLLAYILISWRFLHKRVLTEELILLNFFGQAYVDYQRKVGTGLPFISGYKINL